MWTASHCVLTRFVYGAQFAFHQIINRRMFVCYSVLVCLFVYVCSTSKCKQQQQQKRAAPLIQMEKSWEHTTMRHSQIYTIRTTCCSHDADLPLTEKCLYSLGIFFIRNKQHQHFIVKKEKSRVASNNAQLSQHKTNRIASNQNVLKEKKRTIEHK